MDRGVGLVANASVIERLADRVDSLIPSLFGGDSSQVCLPVDALTGPSGLDLPLTVGPFVADVSIRELNLCVDPGDVTAALVPPTVSPTDAITVRLALRNARFGTAGPMVVGGSVDLGLGDVSAACRIEGALPSTSDIDWLAEADVDWRLRIRVDNQGQLQIDSTIEALDILEFDADVYDDCSLPECSDENPGGIGNPCLECSTVCDLAEFGADLAALLNDVLGDLVDPLLARLIDDFTPTILDTVLGGIPLTVGTELSMGNLLGALLQSARSARPLAVSGALAANGLSSDDTPRLRVAFSTATWVPAVHPCVSAALPGPTESSPAIPEPTLDGDITLLITDTVLQRAVYATYLSGALCLDITDRELSGLTDGAFPLNASWLDLVVPGISALAGPNAAVRLVVRPRFPNLASAAVQLGDSGALSMNLSLDLGLDLFVGGTWLEVLGLATEAAASLLVEPQGTNVGISLSEVTINEVRVTRGFGTAQASLEPVVALAADVLTTTLSRAGQLGLELDQSALDALLGDALRLRITGVGRAAERWLEVGIEVMAP